MLLGSAKDIMFSQRNFDIIRKHRFAHTVWNETERRSSLKGHLLRYFEMILKKIGQEEYNSLAKLLTPKKK